MEVAVHAEKAVEEISNCKHVYHRTLFIKEVHRASVYGKDVWKREEDARLLVRVADRLDRVIQVQEQERWGARVLEDVNHYLQDFSVRAEGKQFTPWIRQILSLALTLALTPTLTLR